MENFKASNKLNYFFLGLLYHFLERLLFVDFGLFLAERYLGFLRATSDLDLDSDLDLFFTCFFLDTSSLLVIFALRLIKSTRKKMSVCGVEKVIIC